ncbi:MAG: deoxyhypusine synthase family protein [Pyrinomonadaceae bacterium]
MVAQKKTKASKFLSVPTRPVPIDRDRSVAGLLEKMEGAGFGAKQLAEAHRIWLDMLDDNCTIYLCGSGNLITSGMRRLISYVIKNRFVDVIVMSGTVIYNDIHETLGRNHFQAHPSMSDEDLEANDIMRVGDVLANRVEYQEADEWIGSVINQLELSRTYSFRDFLHLLGRELSEIAHEDGILTSSFKSRIPVFCPDLPGSELSIGIARAKFEKKIQIGFDTTQDSMELMHIAHKTRHSGVITLGSANSQKMLNVAEIASYIPRNTYRGHKYAICIATDMTPLNTRTPSYSSSHTSHFGKLVRGATTAYVPCDPSIALPMIITALSQTAAKFMKGRKRPTFSFSGGEMHIDVP